MKLKINLLIYYLALAIILQQFCTSPVNCENILFYFVITGYSHMGSIWPLIDKLLDKGHNITVLSSLDPGKVKQDRLKIIVSKEVYALVSEFWDEDADLIKERQLNRQNTVLDPLFEVTLKSCQTILQSPQTQNLIHNTHFDLVILDEEANQCGMAIAHYKYKAPFIIYSAFTFFGFMYDEYGVPLDTSIPDSEYGAPMVFWERLKSTLRTSRWTYKYQTIAFEPMEILLKNTFSIDESISISEIYQHTSLVFLNTHPSTDYSRSLPPLFVQVAGMHITDKRKELPQDLNNFISKPGSDGFIYVSFGTSVRISKSNHEIRDKLFSAMGNTSTIQFVWKWEGEIPKVAPPNIYFSNWLPQQDLYAHARMKGAITHCGINGMHEAVYFGVPMIMFPIVYDQDFNANSMATKGLGIILEMSSFTQEDLQLALNTILTDSKIKNRVMEVSSLFKDRPMKATDTALWWVEHVLRHKYTSHSLVPLSKGQTWYQRRLLDVWFFVFATLSAVIITGALLTYKILLFVKQQFCGAKSRTNVKNLAKKRN